MSDQAALPHRHSIEGRLARLEEVLAEPEPQAVEIARRQWQLSSLGDRVGALERRVDFLADRVQRLLCKVFPDVAQAELVALMRDEREADRAGI